LQNLRATQAAGASSVCASSALAPGVYTAQAEQTDNSGNRGRSSANTFSVDAPAPSTDRVLVGAGDIAACSWTTDSLTGALLGNFPNAVVATFGDNAYPSGTPQQFTDCYNPAWGAAKARTRPSTGSHDYGDQQGGSLAGIPRDFPRHRGPRRGRPEPRLLQLRPRHVARRGRERSVLLLRAELQRRRAGAVAPHRP